MNVLELRKDKYVGQEFCISRPEVQLLDSYWSTEAPCEPGTSGGLLVFRYLS